MIVLAHLWTKWNQWKNEKEKKKWSKKEENVYKKKNVLFLYRYINIVKLVIFDWVIYSLEHVRLSCLFFFL